MRTGRNVVYCDCDDSQVPYNVTGVLQASVIDRQSGNNIHLPLFVQRLPAFMVTLLSPVGPSRPFIVISKEFIIV